VEFVHGRHAICVSVVPQQELRPDRVCSGDQTVIITTQAGIIVLSQSHESVWGSATFELERSPYSEQLRTVVDNAISVSIKRKESFIATWPHPLHAVQTSVSIYVEVNTYPRRAQVNAVLVQIDDDGAAL